MFPHPAMPASIVPVASSQLDQLIDRLSQLPTYTIGRRTDNSIVVPDGKVSGQHARLIQCTATSFVLEDLDSKNGTFVNGVRITRKLIDWQDALQLADTNYTVTQLLKLRYVESIKSTMPDPPKPATIGVASELSKNALDFTNQFADLKQVFEQYPQLRRNCRNREKMIRTGSVILSSIVGISAVLSTGGGALIPIMSGAGLSMLIPTLCSTLLSTDEKLEIIDKEYRDQYRCPNSACRDPFGTREWEFLAQQKVCRRCQAIWVN